MREKQNFPYVFKSGKYKDMSLEWVFVKDPLHLSRIYAKQFGRRRVTASQLKNELQLAIEALKGKLESLELSQLCPVCKNGMVAHILMPDAGRVEPKLVCCERSDCKSELKLRRAGEIYRLSDILIIIPYLNKRDASGFIRAFKNAHNKELLKELS